jgi:hypothetical protein
VADAGGDQELAATRYQANSPLRNKAGSSSEFFQTRADTDATLRSCHAPHKLFRCQLRPYIPGGIHREHCGAARSHQGVRNLPDRSHLRHILIVDTDPILIVAKIGIDIDRGRAYRLGVLIGLERMTHYSERAALTALIGSHGTGGRSFRDGCWSLRITQFPLHIDHYNSVFYAGVVKSTFRLTAACSVAVLCAWAQEVSHPPRALLAAGPP